MNACRWDLRGWEHDYLYTLFTSGHTTLKGHALGVTSVAVSPGGERIVSGSGDRTLKVWDAATGEEILAFRGHAGMVRCVAFSPDGTRIVSGSSDKTVTVWDAATGKNTLTLKGHTGMVNSVAFSPDGKRIASGSIRTLKVWDATARAEKPSEQELPGSEEVR